MELQTSTTFDNGGNNGRPSGSDTIIALPHSINGDSTNATNASLVFEDIDSSCSTPYVSAPSSPGLRPAGGFFYSAPASPMHFSLAKGSNSSLQCSSMENHLLSFEFEFSARFGANGFGSSASMSSADELFLNGKIRPMKLSTHLERPQILAPLMDLEVEGEEEGGDESSDFVELGFVRGRDLRLRDTSLRRRTRSMSPLRNAAMKWPGNDDEDQNVEEKRGVEEIERENKIEEMFNSSEVNTPSVSASSSRSSSSGRSSKRWVFLKDFLYRSKSEGRSTANHKFWSTISFSPVKEKKPQNQTLTGQAMSEKVKRIEKLPAKKPVNGVGKRRVPQSPHELHYTANRAQAEEMRKKTFLPYRQGLLGCLGFSSKGYGAINGFARALNPVSSRTGELQIENHSRSMELEKPGLEGDDDDDEDEAEESEYDMVDGTYLCLEVKDMWRPIAKKRRENLWMIY